MITNDIDDMIIENIMITPLGKKKRRNRLGFGSFQEIHNAMRPNTSTNEDFLYSLQGRESPLSMTQEEDSPQGGHRRMNSEDETLKLKEMFNRVLQELEQISLSKRRRAHRRRSIRDFALDTFQQTDMSCAACSIQ
jgi:hypothetical protein